MSRILYAVTATLPDEATAREYIAWLEGGHVDAVVGHGAQSGMIVRLDAEAGEPSVRVETHYVFATREMFDRYVEKHSGALRADGLKRFPPERGVRFERRIGKIL